jgi:hypothetical protein
MVEHDLRLGKGAGETDEVAELGVVHPRIETEVEGPEPGEARAHLWVLQQPFRADDWRSPGRLVGMRGGDEADAAEAAESVL